MEATVVQILAKFRADVADFNKRVGEVENQLTKLQKSTNETSRGVQDAFGKMEDAASAFAQKLGVVSAIAGTAFVALGMKSFQAAAEVEELDTVMQVVGSTTGVTYQKLLETADAIRDNGIEYASAQQMAIKFAKNSLEVGKAADIARVAQDLAVISQANSTDTANRLTHAVLNLNSMMLRNAGVQTTVSQAVRAYSAENNIAVKSMTTSQKQQAVLNAILKEGAKITGVYTMSMTNAGKVIRSFPRITKQLQVAFGQSLIKPLGPLILQIYELYKNFANLFEEGAALRPVIDALTAVLQKLVDPLTAGVEKAVAFVKNIKPITTSIGEMGAQIQRYLPVIGALGAGLATLGGASLLRAVPVFGALLGALNPVLVGFTVLVALSPKIREAFGNLFDSVQPSISILGQLLDRIVGIANILISGLAAAINKVADFFNNFTFTVQQSEEALDLLTSVAIAATIVAVGVLIKRMALLIKQKVALFIEIYAVVAALGLFYYAMYKAWNSSETFRKIMIQLTKVMLFFAENAVEGVRMLVSALSLVVRAAANTLIAWGKLTGDTEKVSFGKGILNGIDKVNGMFESFQKTITNARGEVDKFNKPFKFSEVLQGVQKFIPGMDKIKELFSGKQAPDGEDGGGDDDASTKALANRLQAVKEALQAYSDFIRYDFVPGFTKDGETARDTIFKALEQAKKVFEAQAQGLEGAALKKIRDAYDKLDGVVRKMIPQAEQIGAAFEALNQEIEDATRALEKANADRAEAISDLSEMMRMPFGEPSEIQKGLSSANTTVDSIISIYDRLVQVVTKRFSGFDNARRDALLEFLKDTTTALVMLAKEREKAVKKWEEETKKLNDLLVAQKEFGQQLVKTSKDYGRALFDVSQTNETTTIQAIKTATGTIITQVKQASGGLAGVQKQLADRLKTIKDFQANIRTLLGAGLNKDYIRQLLEAGPEAAGALAALLATAGQDQISAINSLYEEIGTLSDSFSDEMASRFYDNQIKIQQAIVDASLADVEKIQAAMDALRISMEERLSPLKDFAAQLGTDTAQALMDALTAKKAELVALAESIATAIATAIAAAFAAINVNTSKVPLMPPVTPPITEPPVTNSGSVADWRRKESSDMNVVVNNNNYNPVSGLESGTLTARALERILAKRKSLE